MAKKKIAKKKLPKIQSRPSNFFRLRSSVRSEVRRLKEQIEILERMIQTAKKKGLVQRRPKDFIEGKTIIRTFSGDKLLPHRMRVKKVAKLPFWLYGRSTTYRIFINQIGNRKRSQLAAIHCGASEYEWVER